MNLRTSAVIILSILLVAAIALVPGCDGANGNGNDNGVAPGSPVIDSLSAGDAAIWPGDQTTITASASHPEGDTLTYEWEATGGQIEGSGAQVTWTAPVPGGRFTITLTVRDSIGRQASRQVTITAGATVTGRVIDGTTGDPISDLNVRIGEATAGTDGDGRFSVAGVEEGTHWLLFTDSQWAPRQPVVVDVTTPGEEIALEPDIEAHRDPTGGETPPPPPPFEAD